MRNIGDTPIVAVHVSPTNLIIYLPSTSGATVHVKSVDVLFPMLDHVRGSTSGLSCTSVYEYVVCVFHFIGMGCPTIATVDAFGAVV